jgi:hypothetical protein
LLLRTLAAPAGSFYGYIQSVVVQKSISMLGHIRDADFRTKATLDQ